MVLKQASLTALQVCLTCSPVCVSVYLSVELLHIQPTRRNETSALYKTYHVTIALHYGTLVSPVVSLV